MLNIFALILAIATVVSGICWGYRRQSRSRNLPRGIDTCASLFPLLALVLLVRSFGWEPFRIPSGSMMPTLLTGDLVLADKFSYGLKNPFNQQLLFATGHPKRGDIAIFTFPPDESQLYIKRVIGLPGDRIRFDAVNQQLSIYPACPPCAPALPLKYTALISSEFVESAGAQPQFYSVPLGNESPTQTRLLLGTENLAGVVHRILQNPHASVNSRYFFQQPSEPPAEWVVPAHTYFMMGDNRNNSYDSRFWGFVPERNLVGKAVAIWFSVEKQEGQWPTGTRLKRIGLIH